jgi:hypothetical protein
MELIALLPAALCALACLVAGMVDVLLIPGDRSWVERLEIVEIPLVTAVVSAVAPGLFAAGETVIVLFCLGGALLLARYTAVVLRSWRSGDPQR